MHPFLKQYNEVTVPKLTAAKKYDSIFLIPKVEKVVINAGSGSLTASGKNLDSLIATIVAISGQKPVVTKARKAISGFKIRQYMEVGMKTTIRGERMYDLISKMTQIALPRTRDFRGLKPTSITADGCLHIGIKDSMIFPEVSQDSAGQSLQITLVSTAKTLEEARLLYESLGFIFQSNQ
jgi:large subunit ribosomal protein L5